MVLNTTFNNISVISLVVSFIDGGNYQPAASHWQTLSHKVVSSTPHLTWLKNIKQREIVIISTRKNSYKRNTGQKELRSACLTKSIAIYLFKDLSHTKIWYVVWIRERFFFFYKRTGDFPV